MLSINDIHLDSRYQHFSDFKSVTYRWFE